MATAKKAASKAAAKTKKVTAPAKAANAVKKAPAKKAPVSKTAKAVAKLSAKIATLTERKNKIGTEITALKDQRAALKNAPVAGEHAQAKTTPKPVAQAKKAKPKAKK
ncbi:histone protein [Polaromonas aquatica]